MVRPTNSYSVFDDEDFFDDDYIDVVSIFPEFSDGFYLIDFDPLDLPF